MLRFASLNGAGDRLVGNAARSGRFLYFTHKSWLRIYDAQDPAHPRFVREIFPSESGALYDFNEAHNLLEPDRVEQADHGAGQRRHSWRQR